MGCLLLTLSRASALSISTQRGYWKDVLQYASLSVVNEASFGRSTPLPSIIGSTSHDQTRVRVVREGEGVPPHEDGHQLRQVYSSLQSPSQTLKHHSRTAVKGAPAKPQRLQLGEVYSSLTLSSPTLQLQISEQEAATVVSLATHLDPLQRRSVLNDALVEVGEG